MERQLRAASVASVVAFVALAIAARGDSTLPGDQRFLRWIQERDWILLDSLTRLSNWSTRSIPLLVAGGLIAIWFQLRGQRRDARLLIAALVVMHASYLLKEIVASPRPPGDSAVSFGFPGGRAGNAFLVCGAIAVSLSRRLDGRGMRMLIFFLAALAVVITGVARVRVGAHWPSDILGAWLWSLPALLLLIRVFTPAVVPKPPRLRGS